MDRLASLGCHGCLECGFCSHVLVVDAHVCACQDHGVIAVDVGRVGLVWFKEVQGDIQGRGWALFMHPMNQSDPDLRAITAYWPMLP